MPFGFLSWNWCVWTQNRDGLKLALVDRLDWDVAAFQEVSPETAGRLRERFGESNVVTGLELAGPLADGEDAIDYGCAVVVRHDARITAAEAIPCSSSMRTDWCARSTPSRASLLGTQVRLGDGRTVTAISAHAPHAAGQGDDQPRRIDRKLRTYEALESWIAGRPDVIVGIDGNAWIDGGRSDRFDEPVARDGPQGDVDRFFVDGPTRHGVEDAFRVWLRAHPGELAEIRRRRPNGPLAVTFVRGTSRVVADRFDAVMASPTFEVLAMEHGYEDSVSAGSDHSYVLATLE